MADSALPHSIEILRVHELDSLKTWEEAALVVRRAAEGGADLSSVLEVLRQAFLESHQIPIMKPLADALACHYLNHPGDPGLQRLLADPEFQPYILASLGRYSHEGRNVPLALLLSAFPSSNLVPVLARRCHDHPEQIREVLEALGSEPRLHGSLSILVRDLVQAGNMEASAGADLVAGLLGESTNKDSASSTLVWMAQAGLDLNAALPSLWKGLEDSDPQVRRRCASAMAYHDWKKTRSFLANPDTAVREGATQALALLVAQGQGEPELIRGLVSGLADPEASVREMAGSALGERLRQSHRLETEPRDLLDHLDNPAVVDYAYWWMHRSPERAGLLLTWLEGRSGAESLRRTCQEVRRGEHDWACSICKFIPRSLSVSNAYDVPHNVSRLEPGGPVTSSGSRTCPECGNHYRVSYSEEYDDMSLYVEIQVERQAKPLPERVAHIEAYMREDAVYALSRHHPEQFFSHPDPGVRRAALEALSGVSEPLVGGLSALLQDPDLQVRTRAAHALLPYWVENARLRELLATLDSAPPDVVGLAMGAITHSQMDPEPFATSLRLRALKGPSELRERAIRAVGWLAAQGFEIPKQVELLESLLQDPEKNCRQQAVRALGELLQHWPGMAPRMSRLLTDRELHYDSLGLLQRAAREYDLSLCYPALIQMVLENREGYADDAGWVLEKAFQRQAPRSAEIVSALAPGWELKDESARHAVANCFTRMARADTDLSPARRQILKTLTGPRPTYIESYFASDFAAYLVRHADTEGLQRLLEGQPDVSGAVSGVLAEQAARGVRLSPWLAQLVNLLGDRHWYSRDGAFRALERYAEAGYRDEVLAALGHASGEAAGKLRDKLK